MIQGLYAHTGPFTAVFTNAHPKTASLPLRIFCHKVLKLDIVPVDVNVSVSVCVVVFSLYVSPMVIWQLIQGVASLSITDEL